MLLTLRTTHRPATDLGYLLGKHPQRVQRFALSFGEAHVFFPEADEGACTAALLLDLDPLALVASARRRGGGPLTQYVNDRPYVASSLLSVAISRVLGSALGGRCRERPELATTPLPLEATLAALPLRDGGEALLRGLFEPLGYAVEATPTLLDPAFPGWGTSAHHRVTLRSRTTLSELLGHLYVLVPVLDDEKHYWVGDDEVDKLLAKGAGWLERHPLRATIAARYLKRQRGLARDALARLAPEDGARDENEPEEALEAPLSLNARRVDAVIEVLREAGAERVIDLGCGEGTLLRALLADRRFTHIAGMDVSPRALERAAKRLRLDGLAPRQRARLELFQGSLTYRDARLAGHDAACLIEVLEHVDEARLPAVEEVVFGGARPGLVVLTTPNREYNVRFEGLGAGERRHPDHRFEWSRAELATWAEGVAGRRGYGVGFAGIGDADPEVGPPTQMAIFEREAAS